MGSPLIPVPRQDNINPTTFTNQQEVRVREILDATVTA